MKNKQPTYLNSDEYMYTKTGFPREGEVLDIEPEAGKDHLGPRRDKGHRYVRFDTQVGARETPPQKKCAYVDRS